MRRIRKVNEPPALTVWRATIRPRGSVPPWNTLPNPPSEDMRAALIQEQLQLCCYCTGSISRGDFHIEHFCPRDPVAGDPRLTYVWSNLLASCQGNAPPDLISTRRHCGDAKGNWYEPDVTISPLLTGVEYLFRYPLNGKIYPAKSLSPEIYRAVDLTIEHLHLNAPSLIARRAAILTEATLDAQKLDHNAWRSKYLDVHNGQLQEFWPALEYAYRTNLKPAYGWV